MGFIGSASTLSLTAKMTPHGKRSLLSSPVQSILKKFSLGDSDANYYTSVTLSSGDIPEISGNYDTNGNQIYNTALNGRSPSNPNGGDLYSKLFVKGVSDGYYKNINYTDTFVSERIIASTSKTITGTNLTFMCLERDESATGNTNYFRSLGMPITTAEKDKYTVSTGYALTSIKYLNNDSIVLISISGSQYGDMIDGKNFKLQLPIASGATTTDRYVYSSYIRGNGTNADNDGKYVETDSRVKHLGDNFVLLFSDYVKRPNSKSNLSWGTKHGTLKPFTNGKEYANYTSNLPTYWTDEAVGLLHLDSGLVAITHPTLVNNLNRIKNTVYNSDDSFYYSATTSGSSATFSYLVNDVAYNAVLKAEREEFYKTSNSTFNSATDTVRVSEIGIYDGSNNLVAISKLDRHVEKLKYDSITFTVKFKI